MILEKTNGISDCRCTGDCWLLVYFDNTMKYHFHGKHCGQITGKSITIEYFKTEQELLDRMIELDIEAPIEAPIEELEE